MTAALTTNGLICGASTNNSLPTNGLICIITEFRIAKIIAGAVSLTDALIGTVEDLDEISARATLTDGISAMASDADGGATVKRTGQITGTASEC